MASPHFLNALLLLLHLSVVFANITIPPSPAPLPSHDHPTPSPSPIDPPPPSHPPVESPPPSHPYYPRFKVAVQGVVYCKSCKYIGVDTLMEAAPLPGAVVKLRCGYIKELAKTDKNGYFFFMPPNLKQFDVHKCKVSLISSPLRRTCDVPTKLHDGATGATLVSFSKTYEPWPLMLFSVGPFAFEPPKYKKLFCH